jgi:lactate dehydrogenase-like 2-hydroxyacid dehydrogenase
MSVVITKAVPANLVQECLGGTHTDVIQGPDGAEWNQEEAKPHLAKCQALVTWGFIRVDDDLLQHAPDLKVVANIAVGYDNLDIEALTRRRIWATNVPTAFAAPTAEVALGLMLSVMRRMSESERYVRAGEWEGAIPGRFDGPSLTGKTLGLIGFGRIGQEVAKRANAFGMKVLYYRRSRAAQEVEHQYGASLAPLDHLLEHADVVSLHVPLTDSTRHLIGGATLRRMKPTAYLINTSRGKVVDEQALIEALKEKVIAGAGLDVFEQEPEVPTELLELPNVVMTAHIGGASIEGRREAQRTALQNVHSVLTTGSPLTPINHVAST